MKMTLERCPRLTTWGNYGIADQVDLGGRCKVQMGDLKPKCDKIQEQ